MPTTGLPLPGLIVGDSFGDESDEYPARISWPNQNNCVAGYGYVNDIQPAFATTLANKPNGCAFAILQGGVNDLGDNYDEDDIAAAVTSMITAAQADGLAVVVVSMSPFGGNGGWNSTKQTRMDAYNTWLFANAASLGVVAVDIYSILEDDVTADYLEADYDPGDGLHPNGAGQIVIANAIDTALDSLGLYASVQNVNIETWKGAVEPGRAGPGTTGQVLLWKGAVQPTDYGTIPDISGLDEAAASAAIVAAGFLVGTITNTGSGGDVIAQDPAASTEQLLESSVDFTVELVSSFTSLPIGGALALRQPWLRDLAFELNLTESQLRKRIFAEAQGSATWARFKAGATPSDLNIEIDRDLAESNRLELT